MSSSHDDVLRIECPSSSDTMSELEALRREIAVVRKENAMLTAENAKLRLPAGQFHLFSQLPAELRCKIWEHTICESQVHIFGPYAVSRARADVLSKVCHESRALALKACRSWYTPLFLNLEPGESIKYLHNPELDTFYMPGCTDWDLNNIVHFFCPMCRDCPPDMLAEYLAHVPPDSSCPSTDRHFISKLAINHEDWNCPTPELENTQTMPLMAINLASSISFLVRWNVQELCIVIRDKYDVESRSRPARDISFVKPSLPPNQDTLPQFDPSTTFSTPVAPQSQDIGTASPCETWEEYERSAEELLNNFKTFIAECAEYKG